MSRPGTQPPAVMPELPPFPAAWSAAGRKPGGYGPGAELTQRWLGEQVEALVRRGGLVPEWLVAEADGSGWEVALGAGSRDWRFGSAAGRGFRFSEVVDGREIVFHHPLVAGCDPVRTWPLAARLLSLSLQDHRFRGFDCPVI